MTASSKTYVIECYIYDEANAETEVQLRMHIGGESVAGRETRGIRRHIANQVRFMFTDAQKQDIPWKHRACSRFKEKIHRLNALRFCM